MQGLVLIHILSLDVPVDLSRVLFVCTGAPSFLKSSL
jgi:hypothetical protein